MSPVALGFTCLGVALVFIAMRMPIGVALGIASFYGITELRNIDVALALLQSIPFDFAASWSLSAIPMFLLMGAVAHNTGISNSLFAAARVWLGWMPGGLAIAANFACAGFAAASGSSIATAAAMGRIAIPEMMRLGYDKSLATGVVASAGTLGSLIPPSILFVLFGIFAEVSITKLLIAGVIPGVLTALVYGAMIIIRCAINPKIAPRMTEKVEWAERWRTLGDIWPLMLLIFGIIGGLYAGIVTPTEAGAFGAFLAMVIAFFQRRLNWEILKDSVSEAVSATARIFFVAIGAILLVKFLAMTGLSPFMARAIGDWALDPLLLVIAASIIYLIMGMFLDPIGILLLTLPVLLPMFQALELNLIWFGVLVVKYIEIGLLTPPVGLNVYVIKSVVGDDVPLDTIFKGAAWFLGCEVIIVALLIAFPGLSLYLPSLMEQ